MYSILIAAAIIVSGSTTIPAKLGFVYDTCSSREYDTPVSVQYVRPTGSQPLKTVQTVPWGCESKDGFGIVTNRVLKFGTLTLLVADSRDQKTVKTLYRQRHGSPVDDVVIGEAFGASTPYGQIRIVPWSGESSRGSRSGFVIRSKHAPLLIEGSTAADSGNPSVAAWVDVDDDGVLEPLLLYLKEDAMRVDSLKCTQLGCATRTLARG